MTNTSNANLSLYRSRSALLTACILVVIGVVAAELAPSVSLQWHLYVLSRFPSVAGFKAVITSPASHPKLSGALVSGMLSYREQLADEDARTAATKSVVNELRRDIASQQSARMHLVAYLIKVRHARSVTSGELVEIGSVCGQRRDMILPQHLVERICE